MGLVIHHLNTNSSTATITETTELTINGTCAPKLSHKIPVRKEPNMIAKLESIVSMPIADPRNSSGTKSETQALETPSVAEA